MNTRRIIMAAAVLGALFAVAAQAQTEINPWSDKWFQPPEMAEPWGYDVPSNVDHSINGNNEPGQVVMDDWKCNDSNSPVGGFRWWGSYFDDAQGLNYDITAIEGFYISIHEDIPGTVAPSHPGALIKEWYFTIDQLGDFGGGVHDLYVGDDYSDVGVYEYFVYFADPFQQIEGTVYWVNIVAEIADDIDRDVWGWHTSGIGENHNIDDAVVITDYNMDTGLYEEWYPLEWQGDSLDMAFEIIPEPTTIILMLLPSLGAIGLVARRRRH